MTPPGVANVAPVSPALLTPERLFTAGILGRDSNTGTMPAAIAEQIEMCLARLERVLATDGLAPKDISAGVIYRTRVVQGWPLGQVMESRFGRDWRERIRETIVEALPMGANVAFQGWAARRN
jgi:enamine deaminase RidA (YjgF/YER057c/UK114 family)